MMRGLISAIRFITILPLGRPQGFQPNEMIPFFPMVGLLIGFIVCLADGFFNLLWPSHISALLDVVLLIVITGAFHMDGLGDTADGLFSHKSRENALDIMKDSRIGVMGVAVIVSLILIKWASIWGLNNHRSVVLILAPAYARAGMLFGFRYLPYGRSDGTGKAFFESPIASKHFWGFGMVVVLSAVLGWDALLFNFVFFLTVGGILLFYKKKMNCITGDMLGAMSETVETVMFLTAAIEVCQ